MTWKKKVDANHAEIRQLFRDLGCQVFDSSGIPKFVDLVIQYREPVRNILVTELVEIKDGSLSPSRRRLTEDQRKFHSKFNVHIVECPEDVYTMLGIRDDLPW